MCVFVLGGGGGGGGAEGHRSAAKQKLAASLILLRVALLPGLAEGVFLSGGLLGWSVWAVGSSGGSEAPSASLVSKPPSEQTEPKPHEKKKD